MDTLQQQIRDQQKETWNKFSPGWKKWDELTMDLLRPAGNKIIQELQLNQHARVLDIAAGTGEPGLTIAGIVKEGDVTSTDLSEKMNELAAENASKRGLKNFTTQVCDVSELPFADNTFDAISCRMGFMFFPDMLVAAKQMYRVLKPGGKMATSVWNGPDQNFWITVVMGAISKHMEVASLPPGSPGMFRCSADGMMEGILKEAGFKNIKTIKIDSTLNTGTTEVYWQMMTEVAAPVVAALSKADDETRQKIKNTVFENINAKYPGEDKRIECSMIILSAEK